MNRALQLLVEDLELNHEYCPKEVILQAAAELRRLHNEVARLNAALQREQDRTGRIGTHGPGCHLWGHRHHECLEREYQGAIAALKALVGWQEAEVTHFNAAEPDDWIMDQARAAIAKAEVLK